MAAAGGAQITTVVTVPTRTTRGATTGTVAIGSDSRGGGNNSAPICFFDAIILWARVGDTVSCVFTPFWQTVLAKVL